MTRGAREPDIIDDAVRVAQELDPTLTAETLRRWELAARREFGGRKYYIRKAVTAASDARPMSAT